MEIDNILLFSFFSVVPRGLNFMSRRFGTLCSIFLGGELAEYFETSAHKIQPPGKHPN